MLRPEMAAYLFRGQLGRLQRMGHLAGAWRYIIMLDAGKCCVAESSVWVLVLRPQSCRLSNAVSMGGRRKNSGASVSGADGVHEASETVSSSFALRHHARMLTKTVITCWAALVAAEYA